MCLTFFAIQALIRVIAFTQYPGGVFFMKAYITINRELCKECLLCIWACKKMLISPSEELNSRGYHPVTFRAGETCTGCALCAMICPEVALEVYRE